MPIPDGPITRTEQYLNAMATGDASSIPSAPITRTEQYLDYIAQNGGGGGGSDLPAVTAEDNGDVLTVVSGEWAKAAPSGGGGVLILTCNEQTMALDHTWQEIFDATFAVVKFEDEANVMFNTVGAVSAYGGDYTVNVVVFTNDDPEHPSTYRVTMMPFVTDSADGYPVLQESPK